MMHPSTVSKMEVEPIAVSVPQACQMIGRGTQALYDLIALRKIEAKKSDGRTLIVVESLRRYIKELPHAVVGPPRVRKPRRNHKAESTTA
jgi:hypothetical protein